MIFFFFSSRVKAACPDLLSVSWGHYHLSCGKETILVYVVGIIKTLEKEQVTTALFFIQVLMWTPLMLIALEVYIFNQRHSLLVLDYNDGDEAGLLIPRGVVGLTSQADWFRWVMYSIMFLVMTSPYGATCALAGHTQWKPYKLWLLSGWFSIVDPNLWKTMIFLLQLSATCERIQMNL